MQNEKETIGVAPMDMRLYGSFRWLSHIISIKYILNIYRDLELFDVIHFSGVL